MLSDVLRRILRESGIQSTAELPAAQIPFDPALIDMCAQNRCGNYGKCWTCPPLVGKTADLIAHIKSFAAAVVFQKIYALEDSFDYEGMQEAGRDFKRITHTVADAVSALPDNTLVLAAGGCKRCKSCAAKEGQPCRMPTRAISSLEANAIQVSQLAQACGLRYINGVNTVTYFGAVLYEYEPLTEGAD